MIAYYGFSLLHHTHKTRLAPDNIKQKTKQMKSTKVQSRRCLEASPLFSAQNDSTS